MIKNNLNYKRLILSFLILVLLFSTNFFKNLLNVYLNNDQKVGVVSDIIETGANDVLVITGENTFLVPYLYGQSIKLIDLKEQKIIIDKIYYEQ